MKTAAKEFAGWTILGHEDKPERTWTTDELGSLTTNSGHRISQLRLARIADSVAARSSASSTGRVRRGVGRSTGKCPKRTRPPAQRAVSYRE